MRHTLYPSKLAVYATDANLIKIAWPIYQSGLDSRQLDSPVQPQPVNQPDLNYQLEPAVPLDPNQFTIKN